MTGFLTLDDVDLAGRRVLVRADLNTPLSDGRVTDDYRIRASLAAVLKLRAAGAVVVLCSHLGRPEGHDPRFSLAPVARRMEELGGFAVRHLPQVVGSDVGDAVAGGRPGEVFMVENTRFHDGETTNDPDLAAGLADLAEVFCQDAFGSVHRAHASTVGVAERTLSVAGPLLVSELTSIGALLKDPPRPLVVILGGAKVSEKLGVMLSLIQKCDVLAIGGGMAFTALRAKGYEIGNSLVEEQMVSQIQRLLEGPHGHKIILPADVVAARSFQANATHRISVIDEIREDEIGLDIGPAAANRIVKVCRRASSVFWNGPMGVFEWEAFRSGTETVARGVTVSPAFSVVGGGDSVAAIRMLGLENQVSHLSTGGGAGLQLLEGRPLPGVEVLRKWVA